MSKKAVIILISVIVVLAIIGGFIYFRNKDKTNEEKDTNKNGTEGAGSPAPSTQELAENLGEVQEETVELNPDLVS